MTLPTLGAPDAKATDQTLVSDLFDRHADRLFRLALRMTADREAARDLVQDTFLRVTRRPGRVPAELEGQEAWLVRMLVNLCRDRFRRQAVRERAAPHLTQPPARHDTASAAVARATIARALRRLAPKRRAVIVLRELEGLGTVQVARVLGLRPATVRWHLSAGKKALAAWLIKDETTVNGRTER